MANIVINEVSNNYSFSIGTSSFATVAMPITASWGPGYFDPDTFISNPCKELDSETIWDAENHSDMLDRTVWQRFPATQAGLESFVATYRGPVANYRLINDYSYQMAMTLLNSGYDVLTCRISPGQRSLGKFVVRGDKPTRSTSDGNVTYDFSRYVSVRAKYPGSFGNKLRVDFKNIGFMLSTSESHVWSYYWNMLVYVVDGSGTKTAVENKTFVFDIDNSTDSIPHWKEVESDFVTLYVEGNIPDYVEVDGETSKISLVDEAVYTSDIEDYYEEHSGSTIDQAVAYALTQRLPNYAVLTDGTDKGAIPIEPNDWTVGGLADDVVARYKKLNLLADAKKWAEFRFPWNKNPDPFGDQNIGFEYATVERNYLLTFDYLSGDSTRVVQEIAEFMGIDPGSTSYAKLEELIGSYSLDSMDVAQAEAIRFREWVYTHLVGLEGRDGVFGVFDLLKDKLAYNPNRIISSGWDDQDFMYMIGVDDTDILCQQAWGIRNVSPIHRKLMDVAYFSRCGTSLLDIPRSLDRKYVYNDESEDMMNWGYAQRLARYVPDNSSFTADVQLYHTHSALFTPWARYNYVGMARQSIAPPAFLALMIQRAMILNQAVQYEWALPIDRRQNLKIGKLAYDIPQKLLNLWQKTDGVGVNCITPIPDMGISLWGNSTLFEVPPATYQALANLSTRYLMNAIEDVVYRVGISITFQYNNSQAYDTFYAGVTPILDTMKNVGAIEDYYIRMSLDINELDQVNANSVIGKIYLVINGVVNDITVDLIALPPNTNLDQYRV